MTIATTVKQPVVAAATGPVDWREKPAAHFTWENEAPMDGFPTMASVVPLRGATSLEAAIADAGNLQTSWGEKVAAMGVFQAKDGAFYAAGLGAFSGSSPFLFPDGGSSRVTSVTPLVEGLKALIGGETVLRFGDLSAGTEAPTVAVP